MRPRLAALVLAATLLAACETVDLGDPPADVNACRPSQQFFIDAIWPMLLAQDYGGQHCYDAACHGGASSNSLRLTVPSGAGTIPFPADWNSNYRSVTEQMNCSNVAASKLLAMPSGQRPHRGGMLISPTGPEADLIKMWVSQP